MAKITAQGGRLVRIETFLGVNESPDGDTGLKLGEAARMRNFRVTQEGNLQLRPGYKTVSVLSAGKAVRGIWHGPLESPELLINGEFDGGLSGWTCGANWSYAAGAAFCTAGGTGELRQNLNVAAGQSYQVQLRVTRTAGRLTVSFGSMSGGCEIDASGGRTLTFAATASGSFALAFAPDAAFSGSVDGLSVRRVIGGQTPLSRDYFVAACGGRLWSVDPESFEAADVGGLTDAPVHFFGFGGKLYMLNGCEYKVWNGLSLQDVEGYVPTVATACLPATGGGSLLQQVNKLNGKRRKLYSADGSSAVYAIGETYITSVDRVYAGGILKTAATDYTVDLTNGTVTFASAPPAGTDNVEIRWTKGTGDRQTIASMRFAESYNGYTDNRVFLYGNGTNTAYYSGLTYEGTASAEYFPDLSAMAVDSANTPITAMIRQNSRLLVFKPDGVWSVCYDAQTLEDGSVTAGFYLRAISKEIGHKPFGQLRLVQNNPRSLHENALYEWTQSDSQTARDERSARVISGKVRNTLRGFAFADTVTFDDERNFEYWMVCQGTAAVQNYANGTWSVYTHIPAICFVRQGAQVYFGTGDGKIARLSRDYRSDDGAAIDAYWESGSMAFGAEHMRKFMTYIYTVLKPESGGRVTLTLQTDRKSDYAEKTIEFNLLTFEHIDFAHWSFGTNRKPKVKRIKLKAKKFVFLKLIFSSVASSATATIMSCALPVSYTGLAK